MMQTSFKNKFEVMIIPGLKANGDGRNYLRYILDYLVYNISRRN